MNALEFSHEQSPWYFYVVTNRTLAWNELTADECSYLKVPKIYLIRKFKNEFVNISPMPLKLWAVWNLKAWTSRVHHPRVYSLTPNVQSPESCVQSPASSVQYPTLASRAQEFRYAQFSIIEKTLNKTMLFPVDKKLVSTSGMKDWPKNIFQLRNELFLQAVDRHLRK